jgi:hypothetical protein
VWEPRRATVAVCSDFGSTHEAPWPDHECGIWALASEQDARRRLVSWLLHGQGGRVDGRLGDRPGVALGAGDRA